MTRRGQWTSPSHPPRSRGDAVGSATRITEPAVAVGVRPDESGLCGVELRGFEPLTFSLRRLGSGARQRWLRVDRVHGVPADYEHCECGVRRGSVRPRCRMSCSRWPALFRPSTLSRRLTCSSAAGRVGSKDGRFTLGVNARHRRSRGRGCTGPTGCAPPARSGAAAERRWCSAPGLCFGQC